MPSLLMPYMVLYGCSPWLDAWAEVALLAAAHPATAIATAASAAPVRIQDSARFKSFPLTGDPVELHSNKGRIWRRQGKAAWRYQPRMARGPALFTPDPSWEAISAGL